MSGETPRRKRTNGTREQSMIDDRGRGRAAPRETLTPIDVAAAIVETPPTAIPPSAASPDDKEAATAPWWAPRALLAELRPGVATGGASMTPLVILTALSVCTQFDLAAFGVLVPEIRDWFGISLAQVTLLTGIATVVSLVLALPLGFLGDRWRRTTLSGIGVALLGGCAMLTGFAPTILFLAIVRFGSGLTGSPLEPAHQSLLSDYYPPDTRASVFALYGAGQPLGRFLGPLLAGFLAATVSWQAPFILLSVPCVVLAVVVLTRLREPVRGDQERKAFGTATTEESGDDDDDVEAPPGWAESWRTCRNVRTVRRIWFALPFVVGPGFVLGPLLTTLFNDRYNLGPGPRGVLLAIGQPMAVVGLVLGGALANRFLRYKPGRVVNYAGLLTMSVGVMIALQVVIPTWAKILLAPASIAQALGLAIIGPSLAAVLSLTIPPRVRTFALATFVPFSAIGIVFGLFAAGLGDRYGIDVAILMMSGVFLVGAAILATAGSGVEPDIRAAMAAATAEQIAKLAKERGEAKLLVCRDVDVTYDNVQVLFNVDFEVEAGEMVALLGTNGAGKSTLLRAISGLTTPSNGAIVCDGENITFLPASEHAGRGIILVNGGRGVFPTLTVTENLRLAAWLFRSDDDYVTRGTEDVLSYFPALRARLDEPAGNLSGGEQQMLCLSQAFLSRPKLLMIDELSLGLAPAVVEDLLRIVRAIHAGGTTVILVEQSVNLALTVAKRAVFMEKGEVSFSGPTAELMSRNDILRSVFLQGASRGVAGLHRGRPRARRDQGKGEIVLDVRNVHKRYGGVSAINGISLKLPEATILGLIGPNGAGKTTLFDIISGFLEPDEGSVSLFGEDVTVLGSDARARYGLQRSFQDARLFPALTVVENIAVALERHLETRSVILSALGAPNARRAERRARKKVDEIVELMHLGEHRDSFVGELSTGSRRIVDLACVLAADPQVLLLDEPSAGVAQRETEELAPALLRIRQETGCSMLVIEHDMPLIRAVSDELVALDLGAVVVQGDADTVLEDARVISAYLGTSEDVIRRSGE